MFKLLKTLLFIFLLINMLSVSTIYGQNFTAIKGTVSSSGAALPNVSVQLKGTGIGTTTNNVGNFTLNNIPSQNSYTLVVSSVGYEAQEVPVTSSEMNIELVATVQNMGEVVVIGYGSKQKEDLTTSVSTIRLDENAKGRPSNISSIMQGQMPGVTIQSGGGDPLAGSTISIRGRGSRGRDGDPNSGDGVLFVVDGVPNAPFNMEDVESISVLKDAASAAIYGAYVGSGGVVVVTTKQAKAGKVRVNLNVNNGFKNAWRIPRVLNAEEYNSVVADAVKADPSKTLPTVSDPTKYPYGTVTRTNWLDEVFHTGRLNHYALSLSGGSDKIKSFASVSYDKDQGILSNTYSDKIGGKLNVDFQVTDWMKLSERVTYQYINGQGDINTSSHEGVLINAVFYPTSATVYEYDKAGNAMYDEYQRPLFGGTIPRWAAAEGISGYGEIRNPVATLARLRQNRPSHNIYSTTTMELKPGRGFKIKSDFTTGILNTRYESFTAKIPEPGRPDNSNNRTVSSSLSNNWIWETTADYSKSFTGGHRLTAMIGYTMAKENYRYNSTTVYNFDREDPLLTVIGNGNDWSRTKPAEAIWDESTVSMFGRIDYSLRNRYFLTASLRRDATSKLYKDNNSGIFPAISGSWKISQEDFFQTLSPTITLFKLRASWGQIGNKNLVPRYSYNVAMGRTPDPAFFGDNLQSMVYGLFQSSIPVFNLKWETTEQIGVGLDVEILNNLSFTVDYFNKITKDLIEQIPVPSQAGITVAPYGNIGKVLNRGWEFGANYRKNIGQVNLTAFANLSTVYSEVLDLGDYEFMQHTTNVNSIQPLRSTIGQPWYSYFLLKTDGIFQTQQEIDSYTHTANGTTTKIQPNAKPGDLKYIDFNNDGRINQSDYQYMGSYLPKVTYAFGSNINWKNIDFSFMFQGISGVKIFNGFKSMGITGRQVPSNMLAMVLDSWEYNPNSGIPRLGLLSDPNGNYTNPSDFMLEDGSYLRLKNVALGYTIPKNFLNQIRLTGLGARVYVNAENLLTVTKYTGFDPEVGNFGIDGGRYPNARLISVGLNLNL